MRDQIRPEHGQVLFRVEFIQLAQISGIHDIDLSSADSEGLKKLPQRVIPAEIHRLVIRQEQVFLFLPFLRPGTGKELILHLKALFQDLLHFFFGIPRPFQDISGLNLKIRPDLLNLFLLVPVEIPRQNGEGILPDLKGPGCRILLIKGDREIRHPAERTLFRIRQVSGQFREGTDGAEDVQILPDGFDAVSISPLPVCRQVQVCADPPDIVSPEGLPVLKHLPLIPLDLFLDIRRGAADLPRGMDMGLLQPFITGRQVEVIFLTRIPCLLRRADDRPVGPLAGINPDQLIPVIPGVFHEGIQGAPCQSFPL